MSDTDAADFAPFIPGEVVPIYTGKTLCPEPPSWFQSDGCTHIFDLGDFSFCHQHDWAYWLGGTEADFKAANVALRQAIIRSGYGWNPLRVARKFARGWAVYFGLETAVRCMSKRRFRWDESRTRHRLTAEQLHRLWITERLP